MASITSLSNSSYTSSIYGNRNVLSGLASGMDTEQMIENAVSGIKLKIENLMKKRTKVEWQQEAYRSIIDKAANFSTKYTSYSSKTNLMSASFFNNAVNTAVNGTYKDKITASGRTSSDIKINGVKQMATAASYTLSGIYGLERNLSSVTGRKDFDVNGDLPLNTMSGSLTLAYGSGTRGATFDISFDELEDWNQYAGSNSAEKMANAINDKLSKITYNYTKNGIQESTTADKAIKATANSDGTITFSDELGNGNTVKISSATGKLKGYAGERALKVDSNLSENVKAYEYLAGTQGTDGKWSGGKELSVSFNGSTKKISMSDVMNRVNSNYEADAALNENKKFEKALQDELDSAFGTGKVTVGDDDGKLTFKTKGEGDTLTLGGSAVKALGFESGDSNFINPGKKLTEILGEGNEFFTKNRLTAVGKVNTDKMVDEAGNKVKLRTDADGNAVTDKDGNQIYDRVDKNGKYVYDFKVNGKSIAVNEDTTLESLMNSINSSAEAGVKVSYSKLTNEFKFTATEMGANSKIEFGGLAKDMFDGVGSKGADMKFNEILGSGTDYKGYGQNAFKLKIGDQEITANVWSGADKPENGSSIQSVVDSLNKNDKGYQVSYDDKTNSLKVMKDGQQVDFEYGDGIAKDLFGKIERHYEQGQDAVMDVEINGKRFEDLTRSSNSFDIDGLTVNVKGTFETKEDEEAITFNTTADSDKIVDAIKEFVDDYNEMASEIKSAYSTLPGTDSKGNRYEPLTAEQEDKYSESELKAYNEKAKQGILFGDTDLSSMYSKLIDAIAPGGADGQALRAIGLDTSYSNGMTTLTLDEDKLRAALESDPDKVKNAFTKSKEGGSSSDGLMTQLQKNLNTYVKTTGEPKGVLIQKAGSMKAYTSLNNNTLKSQIDNYDTQIERWQEKMASQIDRYTSQFSRLEQLIAEMNSQTSAMMGLMGGGSGY